MDPLDRILLNQSVQGRLHFGDRPLLTLVLKPPLMDATDGVRCIGVFVQIPQNWFANAAIVLVARHTSFLNQGHSGAGTLRRCGTPDIDGASRSSTGTSAPGRVKR